MLLLIKLDITLFVNGFDVIDPPIEDCHKLIHFYGEGLCSWLVSINLLKKKLLSFIRDRNRPLIDCYWVNRYETLRCGSLGGISKTNEGEILYEFYSERVRAL